jgi:8-oxo-dGTP pyrophosphatase MutT (NUDIX family)
MSPKGRKLYLFDVIFNPMASRQNLWKKLDGKVVHKNPWFYVRTDKVIRPDGSEGEYHVVVSPPAVFIVALDEEQNVYLVGQHRYPTDVYSIEIPAGGSEDEDPLEAAKRELQEEAGVTARNWKKLGEFQTASGFSSEISYVFLATGLEQAATDKQAVEGIDNVMKVSLKESFAMIKRGEITNGQTIAALMSAAVELDMIK